MNQNIFIYALASLLAFVLGGSAFSQSMFHKSIDRYQFAYGDSLANPLVDGSLVYRRVADPALRAFSTSFPEVTGEKWYRLGKYYLVHFTSKSNENKCLYDVKGHLMYSISYGSEKDLPANTRKLVKREYVEYKILQAILVSESDRNIWVINVSDDFNLITARVEDNTLEEVAHYNMSNKAK